MYNVGVVGRAVIADLIRDAKGLRLERRFNYNKFVKREYATAARTDYSECSGDCKQIDLILFGSINDQDVEEIIDSLVKNSRGKKIALIMEGCSFLNEADKTFFNKLKNKLIEGKLTLDLFIAFRGEKSKLSPAGFNALAAIYGEYYLSLDAFFSQCSSDYKQLYSGIEHHREGHSSSWLRLGAMIRLIFK